MRTILIILVTLGLLIGGFFVAVTWQDKPVSVQKGSGAPQQRVATSIPTSRPADAPDVNQGVGQGDRAWVQSFDKKTGELSTEFNAEKYEPTSGDIVNVTAPQAKFYLGKSDARQLVVVRGTKGQVLIPNASKGDKMKGGASAPTRGDLQNVTIELFDRVGDATPQVVCTMPNASFDNDQFRIFTDAYQDEKGNAIAGDQVPVHVTGQYEFDGKGLEIRWNESDRRLQSLEIARGERLVIRDVSTLKLGGKSSRIMPLVDDAMADADPNALPEAVKKKKKKKPVKLPVPGRNEPQRDRSTPIYRATFYDDVKIYEADVPIGNANQLLVDFLMDLSQKPATRPTTEPATAPTTQAARVSKRDDEELIALETAEPKSKVNGPITVRWTGKLRVEPHPDPEDAPASGETNIGLIGTPVTLNRDGSQITGAIVTYQTSNSGFSAESDATTPLVTLKDARGVTITTKSIDYNGVGEPAILEGKSHAEIPIQSDDPSKPAQIVKADWDESCVLQLSGDSVDTLQIQQADLKGNVTLDHPQMHGRSDALGLSFEPESPTVATTQPSVTVKQVLATGKVDYTIVDNKQQSQSIQSENLTVTTNKDADGKLYASKIDAEGTVHTRDAEREMFAGRLAVKLAPAVKATTRPTQNIDVESLYAEDNVRVVTIKGQTASADRLTLTGSNGSRQIELIGRPTATVSDAQSSVSGPMIRFDPDLGNASIIGAGSLRAIQKATPDAKPRVITASWEGDLQLRGKENIATVNGPVTINTPSDDGSINTATGKTLIITLADAPTTQPTKKSDAGTQEFSGFTDKVIQTYLLKDDVEVKSILSDASGAMFRRIHLFTDKLNYDQSAKRLIIPGTGRMLIEDEREQKETSQPTLMGNGLRGATAVEWQKEMSYDETAGRVDLHGGVRVVHKGDGKDRPFEIAAENMSADLEQTTSNDSSVSPGKQQKVDLKKIRANGGVVFNSAQLQFGSDQVEYDPATHRITATAMPGRFSELFDESGVSKGSFSQLIFNTETSEIESMKDFRATVAR